MRKYCLILVAALSLVATQLLAGRLTVRFYGQACFSLVTSKKTVIIMDPVHVYGFRGPFGKKADIVTVSHMHSDHNKVSILRGKPRVYYGLYRGRFYKIRSIMKDVSLYNVKSYHDNVKGKKYGQNSIFVFVCDGLRIVHLGDLGQVLTKEQIREIGSIDVLMIPVGGKYTIHGKNAHEVVRQLNPRVVIPMHYKTRNSRFLPYTAEDFVSGKKNVRRIKGNSYRLNKKNIPGKREYIILHYK